MNFWVYKIMNLIDGKKIKENILEQVKGEVATLSFVPVFCDVLVGSDPSSAQYVRMKAKTAESVGIKFHNASFPDSITTEELIEEIKKINKVENICGIIIQLPLPASIDKQKVLDAIDAKLDVDCLGSEQSKRFYEGESELGFPTALACMAILDSLGLDLKNKKIVVLGQGELVGKPVLSLLKFRELDVVPVRRATENKEQILKEADIIISGIGHGKFVTGDMIKKDVVLIDAGTSESNNAIVGDVDLESVKDIASYVSPVPGGVGPVTVAMLLRNVLTVAKSLK
jgi:methylenetetrahydrofolate dehydrogenase (NADP+)/methenyltetrahydrofolate cyclohydrolase